MVFQDPFSAFNPVFRISHGVIRNLALHRPQLSRHDRRAEAARVFESVGLNAKTLSKFSYEMSGGERQRVGFAQALAVSPKLILADEPVSMLDLSIRAGVLNMMSDLRDQQGVSILYITHDLASARYVADRVLVMYAGHLVEEGPTETILGEPKHPYTQLLLSAAADSQIEGEAISGDTGEPPKVINPTRAVASGGGAPTRSKSARRLRRGQRGSGPGGSRATWRWPEPRRLPVRPTSPQSPTRSACPAGVGHLRLRRRASRLGAPRDQRGRRGLAGGRSAKRRLSSASFPLGDRPADATPKATPRSRCHDGARRRGGAGPGDHDHRWRPDRCGREPGHRPTTGRRQPAGGPDEHAAGRSRGQLGAGVR